MRTQPPRPSAVRLGGVLSAILVFAGGCAATGGSDATPDPALVSIINGDHRSPENRARDPYRHPAETLTFFGLKPDSKVVEVWPANGWYTEVIAPYVRERGIYYVVLREPVDRFLSDYYYICSSPGHPAHRLVMPQQVIDRIGIVEESPVERPQIETGRGTA